MRFRTLKGGRGASVRWRFSGATLAARRVEFTFSSARASAPCQRVVRGAPAASPAVAQLQSRRSDGRDQVASSGQPRGAEIDPEPFGDLAHAGASRFVQSLTDGVLQLDGYRRPSEAFPLALGPR